MPKLAVNLSLEAIVVRALYVLRLSDGVEPQIRNAPVVVSVVIREQRGDVWKNSEGWFPGTRSGSGSDCQRTGDSSTVRAERARWTPMLY